MIPGRVFLVGAGPGSPDLITLRGCNALAEADVIIVDSLLPEDFLDNLPLRAHQEIHWLQGGKGHLTQDEINALIYQHASLGKTVARLKTGDPIIFGRGHVEVRYLRERGILCEIIPGISSATAAPLLADIPLTTPESNSFAVATGTVIGGEANVRLPSADTVVILMGVKQAETIKENLIRDGFASDTPVAVVERSSQPFEREIFCTLEDLPAKIREAHIGAPAVIIVGGAVANLKPTAPTILFTGLDPTNFRIQGRILHWPALRVVPVEEGMQQLPGVANAIVAGEFDLLVFTSRVSARMFLSGAKQLGCDVQIPPDTRVVAAGKGTAQLLAQWGIIAQAAVEKLGSDGIMQLLGASPEGRALLVQGRNAPETLRERLEAKGIDVQRLSLHDVAEHPGIASPLPRHDVLYFASPTGIRSFFAAHPDYSGSEIWCIGDVTLDELRRHGREGKIVEPYV